jgi:hypothetical protein
MHIRRRIYCLSAVCRGNYCYDEESEIIKGKLYIQVLHTELFSRQLSTLRN